MRDDGAEHIPPIEMLEVVHAAQRAKERYGVVLTDSDRASMHRQIREGRGVFVSRKDRSRHVKIWLVWWESAQRIVPVYYHNSRIKTVLPARSVAKVIEQLAQMEQSP